MELKELDYFAKFSRKRKPPRIFPFLKRATMFLALALFMCPVIMRVGGGGSSSGGLPKFTYTGTYTLIDDGDKNWRIKFLTSGTFTPLKDMTIDVFCVGGGQSGMGSNGGRSNETAGGNSGHTTTIRSVVLFAGTSYIVVIGAGGAIATGYPAKNSGGDTSFGTSICTASGGDLLTGGSGGGSGSLDAGEDGSNGSSQGQGSTTREFGEISGELYAGGGAGALANSGGGLPGGGGGGYAAPSTAHVASMDAIANTGSGGGAARNFNGGSGSYQSGAGAAGVVVIRNARAAA